MNHLKINMLGLLSLLLMISCEDPTERQVRKIQERYKSIDYYTDIIDNKVRIVRDIEAHERMALEDKWTTQQWMDNFGEPNAIYDGLGENVDILLYLENGPFMNPDSELVIGASIHFIDGFFNRVSYMNQSTEQ